VPVEIGCARLQNFKFEMGVCPRNGLTTFVGPQRASISAIHAALGIMGEGRSRLELIGRITGQLNPPPTPPPPIGIQKLQVLPMPKTPEASRIEKERLERLERRK
jgi:hypothetical protein